MKSSSLTLPLCWALSGCATVGTTLKDSDNLMKDRSSSAGHPRKVIKVSTRTYNDGSNAGHEVKAFYLHLLESDASVKQQFNSLSVDLREEYGPLFHASDPQVIEWFPSEHSWNAPEEFQTVTNYLVIQRIGYGRSKHAGYEKVIVSEFNVIDSGKAILENSRKNPEDERMSTTTAITFLGFRRIQLGPIESVK